MSSPSPLHDPYLPAVLTLGSSPAKLSTMEIAMLNSLSRLDAAIEASQRSTRPSLPRRLLRGVTSHFRSRFGEWLTTGLLLQFGWILWAPPPVFETSPNLAVMGEWMAEETWGLLCLGVGAVHLLALIVNGTFPRFRYSPHVRGLASLLAVFVWFSITWAIWRSGVGGTGLGTYRLVVFAELFNLCCATMDAARADARRERDAARD